MASRKRCLGRVGRRKPVTFTTLPGGVRLTFVGFLPSKPCLHCRREAQAAEYAKRVRAQDRRRVLEWGTLCLQCDPPEDFPRDLNGVRPTSGYTDANGVVVGWQERDKVRGHFGPFLGLEDMGLRRTGDGVWRPQPKLDRRSRAQQLLRPSQPKLVRSICDHRRCFTKAEITAASRRQHGICPLCTRPFTDADPAVGGHNKSYADGGPTHLSNCVAVHADCNSRMGRRSLEEYLRDQRRSQMSLFDELDSKKRKP